MGLFMNHLRFSFSISLALMTAAGAAAQDRSCKTAEPADGEAFFYTKPNYGGKCVSLGKVGTNIPHTEALGIHDDTSSIKVGNGIRVLLFEHINFTGKAHSEMKSVKDLSGTWVGEKTISSIKILAMRAPVGMNISNKGGKDVDIFEKVGGVDSYLGRVTANEQAHRIYSDVLTTIVGKTTDGKPIAGGFQLKENPKTVEVSIAPNDKGVAQLMLKQ